MAASPEGVLSTIAGRESGFGLPAAGATGLRGSTESGGRDAVEDWGNSFFTAACSGRFVVGSVGGDFVLGGAMLRWGAKYAWSGSRLNLVQPKWEIPVIRSESARFQELKT